MTDETLAGILYDVYVSAVGCTAWYGTLLQEWEYFRDDPKNQRQVEGWIACAAEAREVLKSSKTDTFEYTMNQKPVHLGK
jgi:hypothetical protein